MFKHEGKTRKQTIFVLSAHSDDFVLGAGGTIAKHARQGSKVRAICFSYGEKSHPWLKTKVIKKVRYDEAVQAGKLLKCKLTFFDLRELNFPEDAAAQGLEEKLIRLIAREKPSKIFTHSHEDLHPDHKAVHALTLSLFDKLPASLKPEVYMYSIWNPVSFRTSYPTLYCNVSRTFGVKMKALRTFRSQQFHIIYPTFLVLVRSVLDGLKMKTWFAEKFFRIR